MQYKLRAPVNLVSALLVMLACGKSLRIPLQSARLMQRVRGGASRYQRYSASSIVASATASQAAAPVTISDAPVVTHPSFKITTDEMVDEYGVRATMYQHIKSGAEVLSVVAPDENKVFGITFRTPPSDSTGVPHILEHSVLCGSRKFKSKEPFVELLKGSLQTFLNAFTYPDRTCYPVASCNLKDFYNLIHVYLDAVLHPRAMSDPLVLEQEGWHYELEKPEDPLTFKGVVYNEMKGVYSSPDSRLNRAAQQALFPANTYGVDSGGDPEAIPDLTFDGFKAFHSEFYHPANSRIFFYGDDPVDKRLELLDEYLNDFDAISPDSQIATQPKMKLDTRLVEKFPASEGEQAEKHMIQLNWLLNEEPMSPKEQLSLAVLDHLLLGTSASSLQKALTDSGLGSAVIGGGVSDELKQATFSIGLKGVAPGDVTAAEELISKTLDQIAAEGFTDSAIEASINTIEFSLREFNTGSFPRGLSFMLGAMSGWIYDRNPLDALRFEGPLSELKAELAAGKPVFTDMLRTLVLSNDHKVTIEMVPDTNLESEIVKAEEDVLAAVKSKMSPDEIEGVMEATKKLKEAQAAPDSPEQLATIPALSLDDLPREGLELPNEVGEEQGVTVLRHDVPSNGIIYMDLGFDLSVLPAADIQYLSLFSRCLLETGTATEDEVSLSRRIGSRTGGLYTSTLFGIKATEDGTIATGDDVVYRLFLRGKATAEKAGDLFDIAKDVLLTSRLDNQKRVVEMLKETKARISSSLVSSGHSYASTRLSAPHTLAGRIAEQTGGVAYFEFVKDLLEQAENDWPTVQARLEAIRATLIDKDALIVNLSGDSNTLEAVQAPLSKFVSSVPQASSKFCVDSWANDLPAFEAGNEGFVIPTQVNYVGKGGRLFEPGESVSAATSVVARSLRTGYLWDQVRVIGGAYGGFCRFSPHTGTFSFLSYRDPNLAGTLANYDGAATHLIEAELTDEALSQAIIGAVGDMDSPLGPDQKGFEAMRRYLVGETAEQRQQRRTEVLETTKDDFVAFGERLAKMTENSSNSVVFGSKKGLEDANEALSSVEQLDLKEIL